MPACLVMSVKVTEGTLTPTRGAGPEPPESSDQKPLRIEQQCEHERADSECQPLRALAPALLLPVLPVEVPAVGGVELVSGA